MSATLAKEVSHSKILKLDLTTENSINFIMHLQDFNKNLLIKLYRSGISLKGYSLLGGVMAVKLMMGINSVHSCVRICLLC